MFWSCDRDESKAILFTAGEQGKPGIGSEEVELQDIHYGISVAYASGFWNLAVESDNSNIIANINGGRMGLSPLFLIYEDVLHIAGSFDFISFSFVRRSCNQVAHHIAKWGS